MFQILRTKKGFTLFTALVSLLFLSMSLILIFNMVQTEETYLYLISDKSSLSDLITIADLARSDAFNSFLVHLRVKWEEHYTSENNNFTLTYNDVYMPWDTFVKEKSDQLIFSTSFAYFFANVIVTQLKYSALQPQGYNVKVDVFGDIDPNNPAAITSSQETLGNVIKKMFDDADPEDRIKVVDCDYDTDDTCVGSFYMSLDTTGLDDANFEKLPKISVVSQKTNEVIQKPVFGRFVYRLYMPWRGFQAFRVARRFALEQDVEKTEEGGEIFDKIEDDGHTGLFDGYLINTLNQARLGFCDPKTCAPREDFLTSPSQKAMNHSCTSNPDANFSINDLDLDIENHNILYKSNNEGYNVFNSGDSSKKQLKKLFYDTVEENISERYGGSSLEDLLFDNSLLMIYRSDNLPDNEKISVSAGDLNFSIDVTISSKITKKVESTGSGVIGSISPVPFNNFSQIESKVGGFGTFLYDDNPTSKYLYQLNSSTINNYSPFTSIFSSDLKCYSLDTAKVKLSFEEHDRRYIVGDASKIHIDLIYSFSDFAFPGPNGFSGLNHEKGFLDESSLPSSPNYNKNDWTCVSTIDISGGEKCEAKN